MSRSLKLENLRQASCPLAYTLGPSRAAGKKLKGSKHFIVLTVRNLLRIGRSFATSRAKSVRAEVGLGALLFSLGFCVSSVCCCHGSVPDVSSRLSFDYAQRRLDAAENGYAIVKTEEDFLRFVDDEFVTRMYVCNTVSLGHLASRRLRSSKEYYNNTLEHVILECGDGVEIPSYCFSHFTKLKTVELPNNIEVIGERAFACCVELNVVLPDSVIHICDSAFCGCHRLQLAALPDDLLTIGNGAFESCLSLSLGWLPDRIKVVNDYAFALCPLLQMQTLPDSLTAIGNRAFYSSNVRFDVLPDSVTRIGESAFAETNLHLNSLPANLTFVGSHAFRGCHLRLNTLPVGFSTIGMGAFALCEMTLDAIPSTVTAVGDLAFRNSGLRVNVLPDSITTIGILAFSGCRLNLTALPAQLTHIGRRAFDGCFLRLNDLPENITSITPRAFYNCRLQLRIPERIRRIENDAFGMCRARHHNGIEFPEEWAFRGGLDFEVDRLPENLEYIGKEAFCDSILFGRCLAVPGSVRSIGYGAFGNTALEEIDLSACNYLVPAGNTYNDYALFFENLFIPKSTNYLIREKSMQGSHYDPGRQKLKLQNAINASGVDSNAAHEIAKIDSIHSRLLKLLCGPKLTDEVSHLANVMDINKAADFFNYSERYAYLCRYVVDGCKVKLSHNLGTWQFVNRLKRWVKLKE